MTKITVFKSSDRIQGIECDGHAGELEAGENIVCAAVSVLTINAINSIEVLAGDEMVVDSDEERGFIRILIQGRPSDKCELLLESTVLGLKSIADQYGERFVKIVTQEV